MLGPLDRPAVRAAGHRHQLLLNDEPAGPSVTLRTGDQVTLLVPAATLARQRDTELPVLHRDEHCLVAAKPAGMPFDAGRSGRGETVLERLRDTLDEGSRPRAVHRLDRDTSGVVVLALGRGGEEVLSAALREGRARVEYLAVVRGEPAEAGRVDVPLGKRRRGEPALVPDPEHGSPCRTHWQVEERLRGFSVLRLVPRAGRSHQVRAHLDVLGHPALCDALHGEDDRLLLSQLKLDYRPKRGRVERPLLARPALHAERFVWEGLQVQAPLPGDLTVLLAQLRRLRSPS